MTVATVILSVVLALALAGSAVAKLRGAPAVVSQLRTVGVPRTGIPALGVVELVGAVGLLVGLGVHWVGILAAAGALVYFALAVLAHLRVRDHGYAAAAALGVLSLVVLVLRSATA